MGDQPADAWCVQRWTDRRLDLRALSTGTPGNACISSDAAGRTGDRTACGADDRRDRVHTSAVSAVSALEGGNATFRWEARSSSGRPIRYRIETNDKNGVGDGGTGWWDVGIQTGTSFTFKNVQFSCGPCTWAPSPELLAEGGTGCWG